MCLARMCLARICLARMCTRVCLRHTFSSRSRRGTFINDAPHARKQRFPVFSPPSLFCCLRIAALTHTFLPGRLGVLEQEGLGPSQVQGLRQVLAVQAGGRRGRVGRCLHRPRAAQVGTAQRGRVQIRVLQRRRRESHSNVDAGGSGDDGGNGDEGAAAPE